MNEHTKTCHHDLLKVDWQPTWKREDRGPSFIAPARRNDLPQGKPLWGNFPAYDALNLEHNEGHAHQKDIRLLFAGTLQTERRRSTSKLMDCSIRRLT